MTMSNGITPLVVYKLVDGSPGYRVGDDGSIWSRVALGGSKTPTVVWRRLKGARQGSGHLGVILGRGGRRDFVHRLVLEAFVGPCPGGMECRHLDGDPTNNRLDNLRWGTRKENMEDMVRHGTSCKGERAGRAKLTEADVLQIVTLARARAETYREDIAYIAADFGISEANVKAIMGGRSWTHVTGIPPYKPQGSRPGRRSDRRDAVTTGANDTTVIPGL